MTARWCGHVPSDWPMPQTRMSPEELDLALRDIGKAHAEDANRTPTVAPASEQQLADIRAELAGGAEVFAGSEVRALVALVDRLTAENEALTADLAVPGEGDQS